MFAKISVYRYSLLDMNILLLKYYGLTIVLLAENTFLFSNK